MLSRLSIRQKLTLTVVLPLIAIVALAAVAYPTFQTVKVNGPQYAKIRDAKDIEADILPPPAFAVEAYLASILLVGAKDSTRVKSLNQDVVRLKKEFLASHAHWQNVLPASETSRATMRDAYGYGVEIFTAIEKTLIPLCKVAVSGQAEPKRLAARAQAEAFLRDIIEPAFVLHKRSIEASVNLVKAKQLAVESDTSTLLNNQLAILGGTAIAVFALIGLIGAAITRSINRPIRTLTNNANSTATVELPSIVERVQSGDKDLVLTSAKSEFSDKTDELGELARAFDSMHNTAVSLAANQAQIRRNVSDNLVNIGRRNQGLLKRTLNLISQMEQDERDSSKLEQMFRLDHLTTRMRRNAESLLVLAGGEPPRVWSQNTEIGDVLRAALSQVEAYDRIDFGRLDAARVKGHAINDVAHLIAELVENATYFSPPNSQVTIHGKQRVDGYLVVISDDGVGMSQAELEHANNRIASPQEFDAEPSRVLGHVVVGRLSMRHNIRVRLTESATTGIAAQVLLPQSLMEDVDLRENAVPLTASSTNPQTNQIQTPSSGIPAYNNVSDNMASRQNTPLDSAGESSIAATSEGISLRQESAFGGSDSRIASQPQIISSLPQRPSGHDIPTSELQPRVAEAPGQARQLTPRVRGAQMPDTGPAVRSPLPGLSGRNADNVRDSLGALQRGSLRARNDLSSASQANEIELPKPTMNRNEEY